MPFEGQPIHLTDTQRDDLEEIARSNALPAGFVQRAKIVVLLADGVSAREVETKLDVSRPTIAKWRRRFLEHGVEGLTNRHRGRPPWKLTARVRARVLAATRRPPPDGTTHWSCRRLAAHLDVSKDIVQRVWREADLRPHRLARYMASNDPTSRRRRPTSSVSTWTRPVMRRCSASTRKPPSRPSTGATACCRCRRAGSSVTGSSTSGTVRCRSTRR